MREKGHYWIRLDDGPNWEPAEWTGDKWLIIGAQSEYHDESFVEIDENRITRDMITFDFTYKNPIPEHRNEKGDKLFGLL